MSPLPAAASVLTAASPTATASDLEELRPLCQGPKADWHAHLRWLSFQLGAVGLFVACGAGQALAARASVGQNGKLPYDTTAAVTFAEAAKLLFSLCWLASTSVGQAWPLPWAWLRESRDLGLVAVLFAITNQCNFLIVESLGAALFMLLGNLKIVWTCLFMKLLLGKDFVPLQWTAVAMLTFSACIVKMPDILGLESAAVPTGAAAWGLILLLASTASSGLASVQNELIFKRESLEKESPPMPFMAKNAVLYAWGVGLNFASWHFWGSQPFFAFASNAAAVASIGFLVGLGLACAVILRYLDNVVRCFGSVAQVLATVALSQFLPERLHEGTIGPWYTFSMALLATALVLYQAHASPQLHVYLVAAASGALLVSLACGHLQRVRG
mmetsp:Transcript_130498/g.278850  ORF Transcript_130498/g.278850 Transcript_130498/m.278850 type:complete len:386 (-) Transcript_130498:227-1384(-)